MGFQRMASEEESDGDPMGGRRAVDEEEGDEEETCARGSHVTITKSALCEAMRHNLYGKRGNTLTL